MNRLNEIEARANAATEGPWTTYTVTPHMGSEVLTAPREGEDYGDYVVPEYIDTDNAAFIAHARTDVPDMAAALRAVLELHACIEPSLEQEREQGMRDWCGECDTFWPCPTVDAIRRYLGDDL